VTSDAQMSLDHAKRESMVLRARLIERDCHWSYQKLLRGEGGSLVVGFSPVGWQIGDFHDVLPIANNHHPANNYPS
jgi:hypothetical protein